MWLGLLVLSRIETGTVVCCCYTGQLRLACRANHIDLVHAQLIQVVMEVVMVARARTQLQSQGYNTERYAVRVE